ncbi:hypothetical protein [Vogesella mureinivorans]|nr:hypothetical protein [Vogesella mureinivorans]
MREAKRQKTRQSARSLKANSRQVQASKKAAKHNKAVKKTRQHLAKQKK